MKFVSKLIAVLSVILLSAATTYWYLQSQSSAHLDFERETDFSRMNSGCVLITPFMELMPEEFKPFLKPRVFLVNKRTKKEVKSWSAEYPVYTAKINGNGQLWLLTKMLLDRVSPIEIESLDT